MLAAISCLLLVSCAGDAERFVGEWVLRVRPTTGGYCSGALLVLEENGKLLATGVICGAAVSAHGEIRSNEAVFPAFRFHVEGDSLAGTLDDSVIQGFRDEWPADEGKAKPRREAGAWLVIPKSG